MNLKIYLDANIFIEAFERVHSETSPVWQVLHAIEDGQIAAATSEITLAELLPKPIANGQSKLVALYEGLFLDPDLFEACPVTRDILLQAAKLRATRLSLRLPDAIHLATAAGMMCSAIPSNDQRIHAVGTLPLVPIGPDTLSKIRGLAP